MKRPLHLLLVASVAVCLGAAACGSTPVAPPPPPPPPPVVEPPPPPPPPAPTLKITKILAFGDSQTEGCRTQSLWLADPLGCPEKAGQSYPAKLLAILKGTYYDQPDIQVINGGKGGEVVTGNPETSNNIARPRLQQLLQTHKPDVVILMHGINDLTNEDIRRADIVDAMEDLVRDIQAAGMTVFLSEAPRMVPNVGNPPKGDAWERVPAYNADLANLAARRGAEFVRVFDHITEAMISTLDGLHLTQAGNQRLAEVYFDALKAKYHVPAPTTIR